MDYPEVGVTVLVSGKTKNAAAIGSKFPGYWDGEQWWEGEVGSPDAIICTKNVDGWEPV